MFPKIPWLFQCIQSNFRVYLMTVSIFCQIISLEVSCYSDYLTTVTEQARKSLCVLEHHVYWIYVNWCNKPRLAVYRALLHLQIYNGMSDRQQRTPAGVKCKSGKLQESHISNCNSSIGDKSNVYTTNNSSATAFSGIIHSQLACVKLNASIHPCFNVHTGHPCTL